MAVRSHEEDSEFVKLLQIKITEETCRSGEVPAGFWLEATVPAGWIGLDQYLERHGPFPIDDYWAASITQQIASAVLFLHQSKMAYGILTASSIVVDLDGIAHLLPPPPANYQRYKLDDDIRSIGKLLLRLVSGQNQYPPPHLLFPVNRSLCKLAGFLLETPMTAGQV
ncbi:hypothetical protein PFISCL1PPCAC_16672, partial [Pristionchus fissidentatus]